MFAVCAVPRCCDNAQGGHGSDDAGPAAALVLLGREHLMDNTTDSKAHIEEEVDAAPWSQLVAEVPIGELPAEGPEVVGVKSLPGVLPREAAAAGPAVEAREAEEDERPGSAPWKTGRSSRSAATAATSRSRDPEREARKKHLRHFLAAAGFRSVNEPKSAGILSFSRKLTFPLHAAVKKADAEIVELLLWAGADRAKRDSMQATALELARRLDRGGSHAAVIAALEEEAPASASPSADIAASP